MKIMQIISNARRKTVVFKPEAGQAQVRCFPTTATREEIVATLEKNVEKKKSRKQHKPKEIQS